MTDLNLECTCTQEAHRQCNRTQEALVDELLLQQGREKISFWRRQRLPEGENLHTARPAESLRQCSFPYDLPILAMNFQVPKGAPFGIPENSWEFLRILEDPCQESWESWEFWKIPEDPCQDSWEFLRITSRILEDPWIWDSNLWRFPDLRLTFGRISRFALRFKIDIWELFDDPWI